MFAVLTKFVAFKVRTNMLRRRAAAEVHSTGERRQVGGEKGTTRSPCRPAVALTTAAAGGTNADARGVKSSVARMAGVAVVVVILAPVPQSRACVLWAACAAARRTAGAARRLDGLELHMRSTSTKLVESSTPFRWMNTSLPILNFSPARVAGESAVASCCDESAIGSSDVSTGGGSTRLPQR